MMFLFNALMRVPPTEFVHDPSALRWIESPDGALRTCSVNTSLILAGRKARQALLSPERANAV